MPRGPLSAGGPKLKTKKEKKPKIPKEERVKRVKKPPHPDNIAPDRKLFGTKTAHAKWPAMFKRHLGVIETHIRNIDRVMQSMQSNLDTMDEEERKLWESGEKGMWILACGMMQRAQVVLKDARSCAAGVLPAKNLKEKKSLGAMAAVAEKYKSAPRPANWQPEYDPDEHPPAVEADSDPDSDSDSSSASSDTSSDSGSEEEIPAPKREKSSTPQAEPAAYKPLNLNKKRKLSSDDSEKVDGAEKPETEANPYFVVDANPTPINLLSNGAAPAKKAKKKHLPAESTSSSDIKSKKRTRDDEEVATSKKSKKDKSTSEVETRAEQVDFTAVERQLQAEVAAGLEAQAKEKARKEKEEKKEEKKRKRVSDGTTSAEVVGKKAKKEKRKVDDGEVAAVENVVEEGKKKKRKHKVEE